jgi:spore germination cell wall hydrolase CwlJ-like protein
MGQLAVGRVIVNRAHSGRFPGSYCGVVYQRSQYSFNHNARGALNARLWRNAVAVAHIAHEGTWRCDAEGALYFHAARVSPNWGRQKVARIDNHIFYR